MELLSPPLPAAPARSLAATASSAAFGPPAASAAGSALGGRELPPATLSSLASSLLPPMHWGATLHGRVVNGS